MSIKLTYSGWLLSLCCLSSHQVHAMEGADKPIAVPERSVTSVQPHQLEDLADVLSGQVKSTNPGERFWRTWYQVHRQDTAVLGYVLERGIVHSFTSSDWYVNCSHAQPLLEIFEAISYDDPLAYPSETSQECLNTLQSMRGAVYAKLALGLRDAMHFAINTVDAHGKFRIERQSIDTDIEYTGPAGFVGPCYPGMLEYLHHWRQQMAYTWQERNPWIIKKLSDEWDACVHSDDRKLKTERARALAQAVVRHDYRYQSLYDANRQTLEAQAWLSHVSWPIMDKEGKCEQFEARHIFPVGDAYYQLMKHAIALDFYGSDNTFLTDKLLRHAPDMQSLTTLKVGNCKLSDMRPLCALVNLKILHIYNNAIARIPDAIAQCSQLAELHASHNNIGRVPAVLGKLSRLSRLDLSHNDITSMDQALILPDCLWILKLQGNKLKTLPLPFLKQSIMNRSWDFYDNPLPYHILLLDGTARGVYEEIRDIFSTRRGGPEFTPAELMHQYCARGKRDQITVFGDEKTFQNPDQFYEKLYYAIYSMRRQSKYEEPWQDFVHDYLQVHLSGKPCKD